MKNKKVTIIGLGLIGGSLARALHERFGINDITAINRSRKSIDLALKDGCISRGFDSLNNFVYESDIIFICTPVKLAIEYLNTISKNVKPDCIVTDVGSTKGEIINYVNSMKKPPCFIGGHPMAGTEKTGYSSSFSHLFENAYYILTPGNSTTESSIAFMTQLVKAIGAIPIVLGADEHDKITGTISHTPHIIASCLVNLVNKMDSPDGKIQMLAAGGFKDITRIASSSPEMWENIVLSNKQQILNIMNLYITMLNDFKQSVDTDNSKDVFSFFDSARIFRNSLSSNRKGLISTTHEIIVDVVDKPGIIGEIATILGNNDINIKNINVSNSREFEQGCLTITLPDAWSVDVSFDLLNDSGYKVFKSR